jgi:hypothetical protein
MNDSEQTLNEALQERIIKTADEYHFIAEDQWAQAIDLAPETEEAGFEFRRMIRAAMMFYTRALLILDMVETDEEQQFEELLDIAAEQQPELAEFMEKNNVTEVLDEDANSHLSQVFATAEALRSMLLQISTQLAATLGKRF